MTRFKIVLSSMGILLLFVAGCGTGDASPTPTFTATFVPTDTATSAPNNTPLPPATDTRTPLPTLTATDPANPPTAAPTLTPTEELIGEGVAPPFDIDLPSGWQQRHVIVPVRVGVGQSGVPVSMYAGAIPDHEDITGNIVVVWGFPSLSASVTSPEPDLWADGLRYLRGLLLDTSCNIGTDLEGRTTYSVGGRDDAVGTAFAAVDCIGEPDTAGWFAGLNEQGGNYVFYIFTVPLEGIDQTHIPLQEILNSISWHELSSQTPEAE